MSKAKTLAELVSTGSIFADGGVSAAEVTGLGTLATLNAASLTTNVSGTLPIANGGTGSTSTTYANLTTNVTGTLPIGNGGTNATTADGALTALGGTTVGTGVFKAVDAAAGRTALGAASSGANSNITSLTGLTTPLTVAQGGIGATSLASANIPALNVANTFTGTQSFTGTSSTDAVVLTNAAEVCTVSATAATGTIAYYPSTQSVLYYTSNASGNWTLNLTFSAGTTLDSVLTTGQSLTVAFLVTQGATAYYNSSVQVDGTTSGVTTRWQGGAPTKGNASGIDIYTYTIIKTASATFTVIASQVQFKA
jgi:hypothetical protein